MPQVVEQDEIAGAFAYLENDDARHVTGQMLVVDAGASIARPVYRNAPPAGDPPDLASRGLARRSGGTATAIGSLSVVNAITIAPAQLT